MRPHTRNFTPEAANLTGYASNVTGDSWTISTTSSGDDLAHQVTIRNDSATDHSAKTVTLTGTDSDGITQTEVMNLPGSSATVTSTKFFRTLLTAVPSASIGADTMDIGWAATSVSRTCPCDWVSVAGTNIIQVDITGTINFTVQELFEWPFHDFDNDVTSAPSQAGSWTDITALASKTADTVGSNTTGATAWRFKVNSITAGATAKINSVQPYLQ